MLQYVVLIAINMLTLIETIGFFMAIRYAIKKDKKNKDFMWAFTWLVMANNKELQADYIAMLIAVSFGIYFWKCYREDLEEERG